MKYSGIKNYLSFAIKLILVVSLINGIYNHLWHLVSTNIFLLILVFIPQVFTKYEIKIPKVFEWFLLVFVIFTLFLGNFKGVVVPIVFGISIAMIGFMILAILYSSNQIKKNYFLIIVFSFNFAVSLGFAIELLKYYLKLILGHELSASLYSYSMQTMTFVVLGALISSVFGYFYMKNYKSVLRKFIDKFIVKNSQIFSGKENLEKEILDLIEEGEKEKMEFKSTLRVNLHTNDIDKKIEHSILKTLVAFLNSDGGNLFIGISNSGEIIGIEKDRFENSDKFLLHLTNLVKDKIGKKFISLMNFQTIKIHNKTLVQVSCKKSSKPVFLKSNLKEEEFYIRAGPSTIEIKASELVDYIGKRFGRN